MGFAQKKSSKPDNAQKVQRAEEEVQGQKEVIQHPNTAIAAMRNTVQRKSDESEDVQAAKETEATIQPKLTMGHVGDKYEKEADETAARVMARPMPKITVSADDQPLTGRSTVAKKGMILRLAGDQEVAKKEDDKVNLKDFLASEKENDVAAKEADVQEKADPEVQSKEEVEVQQKSAEEVQSKEDVQEKAEPEVQSKEEDVQQKSAEEVQSKEDVQEKADPEVQSKEEDVQQKSAEEVQSKEDVQEKAEPEVQSKEEDVQKKSAEEVQPKEVQLKDFLSKEAERDAANGVQAKETEEVSKKSFIQTVLYDESKDQRNDMINAKVEFPKVPKVDQPAAPEDLKAPATEIVEEPKAEAPAEKEPEGGTDVPAPEPVKELKKGKSVQKKGDNSKLSSRFEARLKQTKGGGFKMPKALLKEMEQRFGVSFAHIRIHTDAVAHSMCKEIGARAFTNGRDIYFSQGEFNPSDPVSKLLLAHELTHTIQQGAKSEKVQALTRVPREVAKPPKPENPKDGDPVKSRGKNKYEEDDDFDSDAPRTKSAMDEDAKKKSKPDRGEVRSENSAIKKEGIAEPDADRGGDAHKKSLEQKSAIEGNLSGNPLETEEEKAEKKKGEEEASEADQAAARRQEALAAANAVVEGKPQPKFVHPEIKGPVDSKGKPLPRQAAIDTRVRGLAYMAEMFRDAGYQMHQGAAEDARLSWGIRASVEQSKEDLAITKEGTAKSQEHKLARIEIADQSKLGLVESEDRQSFVEQEAPATLGEANEGKKDSSDLSADTKKTAAENESEQTDDEDAKADQEEANKGMEESKQGAESMDGAVDATATRSKQYIEDAEFAKKKNTESKEKIAENDETLLKTDERLAEMEGMNAESTAQIEASDTTPEVIMEMSKRKAESGSELIAVSFVMESELLDIQKNYFAGMKAIEPREEAEKRAREEAEKEKESGGFTPEQQELFLIANMEEEEQDTYIQGLDDEQKKPLIAALPSMVTKDEKHDLAESEGARYKVDTGLSKMLGENPTDPRQEEINEVDTERKTRVDGVLDIADKNMDFLTEEQQGMLAEKLNAESLVDDVKNISVLQMGKDMLQGMVDPRMALKGVVGGFEQMLGGLANIGNWEAWKKDPLGNLLSIGADISTGLATIFTSIIGIAGMIFGLMLAITIASWGFALPFTGPVMGWMGTVMSTVGWWAVIAGALAVLFNSLSYIKNLHDASTAPTAREFFGNVDEMKEDSMGVLTGVMAIAGGKGAQKMGPNMKSMNPGKGIPKNIARQKFRADMKAKATALPKALGSGAKKLFAKGQGGVKALMEKFKKWFGKDKDAPGANSKPVNSTHAPKGKDLGSFEGKPVKSELDFPDGHKGKVLNDGQCVICSNCKKIRGKFKKELDANPELEAKLKKLEDELKMDPKNQKNIIQQKKIHDELMYQQQADLLPKIKKMQLRIKSGDRSITKAEYYNYYKNKRKLEGTRRHLKVPQHNTPFKPLTPKQKRNLLNKQKKRTLTKQEFKRLEWDRRFNNRRRRGVARFWTNERKLLKSGGEGTRNWTPQQKADILNGKTPSYDGVPIEGHHRYNALDHPQIADDPFNIYGASYNEHYQGWHGSNFQNDTFGFPHNESFGEQF